MDVSVSESARMGAQMSSAISADKSEGGSMSTSTRFESTAEETKATNTVYSTGLQK